MPNVEVLKGDCGLGQLTQKGYMQHIDNGQVSTTAACPPSHTGAIT